jgi:hypothetical protein
MISPLWKLTNHPAFAEMTQINKSQGATRPAYTISTILIEF